MHLTGQSDAAHVLAAHFGLAQDTANRLSRRVPPVFGPLLGPPRPLHAHVLVRGRASMADAPGFVH